MYVDMLRLPFDQHNSCDSFNISTIILLSSGDGPWDMMREFDDGLPRRDFDNFQFVDFHQIMTRQSTARNPSASFAYHALQEIPAQYKTLKRRGMIG